MLKYLPLFKSYKFFRRKIKMGLLELFATAVALSMDAFAVAICKGLATSRVKLKHMLITGAWFGGFQALMPLVGFLFAQSFADFITPVDHWIAFLLMSIIGFGMIKEALGSEEEADSSLNFKLMLTMALATSIDALAVGISFALIPDINIVFAIASIGIITFVLSALGVKVGQVFGSRWRMPAELVGGGVLIGMGLKILIQHIIEDKKNYDLIIATCVAFLLAALFALMSVNLAKKNLLQKENKRLFILHAVLFALLFVSGVALLTISLCIL